VSENVTSNLDLQRGLYGEPLRDLADRVMVALGLTQGRLAQTLGLSAPMLSQLMSGRRIKIGNPAVVHRLYALLELADEAPGLAAEDLVARIEAVHEAQGTYATTRATSDTEESALAGLREVADSAGLRAAADLLRADHPGLSALLSKAAEGARG
jgi:predicted transcriptional regulator